MIRLIYKSIQKATKDVMGVTQVTLDSDGNLIELGNVTVKKGSSNFKAILMDGSALDGKYKTKKQAGGALQKKYNGDKPQVKKAFEIEPNTVLGPPEKLIRHKPIPIEEPKVVEPVVEVAPEPIVETVQPDYKIPFTMGDLLDEDFDGDGFPVMPTFLRRDLWTAEEREYYSD